MEIDTQGETLIDAIGIMGIDMEDENEPLPTPTAWHDVKREHETDIVSLVDVDFTEYRRKNDMRSVKGIVPFRLGFVLKPNRQG